MKNSNQSWKNNPDYYVSHLHLGGSDSIIKYGRTYAASQQLHLTKTINKAFTMFPSNSYEMNIVRCDTHKL